MSQTVRNPLTRGQACRTATRSPFRAKTPRLTGWAVGANTSATNCGTPRQQRHGDDTGPLECNALLTSGDMP